MRVNIPICRHCNKTYSRINEPIYMVCLCDNVVKYAHGSCFREWLKTYKYAVCNICLTKTKFIPEEFKPLSNWRLPQSDKKWIGITYTVILTLSIISLFVYLIWWQSKQCYADYCLVILGLLAALVLTLSIFGVFVTSIQQFWLDFKAENKYWKVVYCKEIIGKTKTNGSVRRLSDVPVVTCDYDEKNMKFDAAVTARKESGLVSPVFEMDDVNQNKNAQVFEEDFSNISKDWEPKTHLKIKKNPVYIADTFYASQSRTFIQSQINLIKQTNIENKVDVNTAKIDLDNATSSHGETSVMNLLDEDKCDDLNNISFENQLNNVEYSSSSNTQSNNEYSPSSNIKNNIEYSPSSNTQSNIEYSPSSNTQSNIEYSPSLNIQNKVEYSPSSNTQSNIEYSPSLNIQSNVEYSSSSNTQSNVEYSPSFNIQSNIEYSPSSNTQSNVEYSSSSNIQSNIEYSPSYNTQSNVEYSPSSHIQNNECIIRNCNSDSTGNFILTTSNSSSVVDMTHYKIDNFLPRLQTFNNDNLYRTVSAPCLHNELSSGKVKKSLMKSFLNRQQSETSISHNPSDKQHKRLNKFKKSRRRSSRSRKSSDCEMLVFEKNAMPFNSDIEFKRSYNDISNLAYLSMNRSISWQSLPNNDMSLSNDILHTKSQSESYLFAHQNNINGNVAMGKSLFHGRNLLQAYEKDFNEASTKEIDYNLNKQKSPLLRENKKKTDVKKQDQNTNIYVPSLGSTEEIDKIINCPLSELNFDSMFKDQPVKKRACILEERENSIFFQQL